MTKPKYGKNTLGLLLNFDWSSLGAWYKSRKDGVWWKEPTKHERNLATPSEREIRTKHPAGDLDKPALPFPFTVGEFIAFCDTHPTFADEFVEARYSNNDGSLDEAALAELARENRPAVELVLAWLTRASGTSATDALSSAGLPVQRSISETARKAAEARHAENHSMRDEARAWYAKRRDTMSKNEAARQIAGKEMSVKVSTVRSWLKGQ